MKQLFFKLFKIVLILTLVLFVLLLIAGALVWANWPLWTIFFVVAALAGIILGLLFLKRLVVRRNEQRFVEQIILQDEKSLHPMGEQDRNAAKEMQEKWKQAMDALKSSHLKNRGNPLYVLPWYMVIGTSGSGKTTAIKSARLTSSFEDAEAVAGLSGTKNCDWWFFEQAILIDTAGRYAVPVDETRDRNEWQRFLSLLARYRKKEPLNGLIVTIPADTLYTMDMEAIDGYGKEIRMRIDEIMRVIGSKFPVYAMVTKCDLVQGMTQFCDSLPQESLEQVMGTVNPDPELTSTQPPGTIVSHCFETMGQRIRDILLLILQAHPGTIKDPDLLLFPKEFGKLEPNLEKFINRVFQQTPYQETPLFRGIFFTSGRQEGTPFSHFLKDLGLISEQQVLPGTNKGLFLHNFFAALLPGDRGLFSLTARGAQWIRLTKSLGFASFVAIIITFCGLLSFSFVKNLNTLKQVTKEFAIPEILSGELLGDTITLERFNQSILRVEEQNKNWWIPRFGLTESLKVETQLKEKFCTLVRSRFISPLDKRRADAMAYMDSQTDDQSRMNHMVHLARRINLIRARLLGKNLDALSSLPQPDYRNVDLNIGQAIVEEVRQKLKHLYLYTLVWQTDTEKLNMKMNDLQQWLERLLTLDGTTMNWLVTWANEQPDLQIYTLGTFWGKSPGTRESIRIMPAFTLKGRDAINNLVQEMETALTSPLVLAARKRDFHAWYATQYLNTWHDFIEAFPSGKETLPTRDKWKSIVETIHKLDSPFQMILDTAMEELEPFGQMQKKPPWIGLLNTLAQVEIQASLIKAQETGKTGIMKTAADRLKSKLSSAGPSVTGVGQTAEASMEAGKALVDYRDALAALAPMAASTRTAFTGATTLYTGDPATNASPFLKGRRGLDTLKKAVGRSFEGNQEIWTLMTGPLDFAQEFVLKESACELQRLWEKTVLVELGGVQDSVNAQRLVMGKQGFATRFLEAEASPFIERNLKRGFHAVKINNKGIDFSPSFLTFLTRGKVAVNPSQNEYTVKITGAPTSANDDALFQPHATLLTLECADKTTTLENFNYPVKRSFPLVP